MILLSVFLTSAKHSKSSRLIQQLFQPNAEIGIFPGSLCQNRRASGAYRPHLDRWPDVAVFSRTLELRSRSFLPGMKLESGQSRRVIEILSTKGIA